MMAFGRYRAAAVGPAAFGAVAVIATRFAAARALVSGGSSVCMPVATVETHLGCRPARWSRRRLDHRVGRGPGEAAVTEVRYVVAIPAVAHVLFMGRTPCRSDARDRWAEKSWVLDVGVDQIGPPVLGVGRRHRRTSWVGYIAGVHYQRLGDLFDIGQARRLPRLLPGFGERRGTGWRPESRRWRSQPGVRSG